MSLKIITVSWLQRYAKNGITFPEQEPVNTVLFGHSGITFLFYRNLTPVGLFISHKTSDDFHLGWKVFKRGTNFGSRFYEIHDVSSIGFDKSILPSGLLI